MTFCRLVEDKIAESWTSWDTASVLRQLGVLPPEQVAEDGSVAGDAAWEHLSRSGQPLIRARRSSD